MVSAARITQDFPESTNTTAMQYPTPSSAIIPIAGTFLYKFNECTGYQEVVHRRPVLLESPSPGAAVVIVVHDDDVTHGIVCRTIGIAESLD